MALAIALAGQQPVPIGRACALTFDQPQSLSVTETLAHMLPAESVFGWSYGWDEVAGRRTPSLAGLPGALPT
jgi:hypothetical protein